MDWNRVEGNWKEMKGKAKGQWGKLTDDDLDVIAGKQDQLEGRLQQRYGYEGPGSQGSRQLVRTPEVVNSKGPANADPSSSMITTEGARS